MERDPYEGGADVGRDHGRDLGDEPPVLIRDTAPDVFAPIDASAPVSGHLRCIRHIGQPSVNPHSSKAACPA